MTEDFCPPPLPATTEPREHLLHALVDGQLSPAKAQALRAQLNADEQNTVTQWEQQRVQLQALQADWARQHPAPPAQQQAAQRLQALQDQHNQWWRWGGMAAGWMLAFGLGWLVHGHWLGAADSGQRLATATYHGAAGSVQPTSHSSAPQLFVQQAAVAFALYQPEQRHPVEVAAAQQEHLVQWLSKRLGRPLKIPALGSEGFELVGGRLLPGLPAAARAQFMYQNAAGLRITLYLGALETPDVAQETAFRFHTEGPVASFYWVDQGFGYALSGELPRATLLALATSVHRQL
jgi:anti-sigma factor RsiW